MILGPLFVLLLIVLGIWYLLDRREKARLAKGLPRHSSLRLIFASFAILTVLFSGGCGSVFPNWLDFRWCAKQRYVTWEIIAILSLPPLLIGLLVWWLAMRRKSG